MLNYWISVFCSDALSLAFRKVIMQPNDCHRTSMSKYILQFWGCRTTWDNVLQCLSNNCIQCGSN